MIALPSIAFEGFSGSAKGVTARRVGGRNILSVKSRPTGPTTNAQVVRRASMSKISKSWKQLTNEQMREWDRLAEHTSGQSVFGQKAELTGMNLYIRLNVNRAMAGEALLSTAPESTVGSCMMTIFPSAVSLASSSIPSAPTSRALRKAVIVFSGYCEEKPL